MLGFVRVFRSLGVVRAIALGFVSAQLLVACGSGGSGVEGTYVWQMGDSPGEGIKLELMAEGKALLTMPGVPPVPGAHSMEGDKLVVVVGGDRDVYTIEANGDLTTTEMGEKVVMVKQ
jgi:hypothetical protein